MSGRVRPARPYVPIGSAVLIILGWFLVAHNSGDGWVQVIGDAVFALLAAGTLGPALILARTKVTVTSGQFDGHAGAPVSLEIQASSRVRIRPVAPPGPDCLAGPVGPATRSRRDSRSVVSVLPTRRGTFSAVVVDVATAAPFGLQWWTRRLAIPLPATLHVAPRHGHPIGVDRQEEDLEGWSEQFRPGHVGESAGVRPYTAGDPRSHVHWPATAHNRALMVREMEIPAFEAKKVTVRLPPDPDDAERLAESAMETLAVLLERGGAVLLSTLEATGEIVAPVDTQLIAGRRLARAVCDEESTNGAGDFGVEVTPWA